MDIATVLWTSTTTWGLVLLALMGVHLITSTMSSVMEYSQITYDQMIAMAGSLRITKIL
jgi:hypothetical protein